jgi:hypothetical protein
VQFSRSDGELRGRAAYPRGAHKRASGRTGRRAVGLSKLSSMANAIEIAPASKPGRHARTPDRRARRNAELQTGALIEELPRKEVIQPHLPVRLPCYDFTPITSPTFDGSLP